MPRFREAVSEKQNILSMEWNAEEVLKFIELYRGNPHLWDTGHIDYRNKPLRRNTLTDIGMIMGVGRDEIERRIKNLQSQFLRERKKESAERRGSAAYVSRWFAYKPLMFLAEKFYQPRGQKSPTPVAVDVKVEHFLELEENSEGQTNDDYPSLQDFDPDSTGAADYSPASASEPSATTEEISRKRPKLHQNPSWHLTKQAKLASEALYTYNNHNSYTQSPPYNEKDEFSLYGEQVAIKIRKLVTPRAKFIVQNMINRVLFDAEMGLYDDQIDETSAQCDQSANEMATNETE